MQKRKVVKADAIALQSIESSRQNETVFLPYRRGVGMMILNSQNMVFVGKRIDSRDRAWQMPQGGIDFGESPANAVLREMKEEIGCNKGRIIAETAQWYSYRFPPALIPKIWGGRYCGQKQKWFLIEYHGTNEEINISSDIPEFCEWSWVQVKDLVDLVVPFRRRIYGQVVSEFQDVINTRW